MHLPNRDGTPVDPVPFLVVSLMAFAVSYAFGPMYFSALGLPLDWGVALSTGAFLGASGVAFHRYVWSFDPAIRDEVPASDRFRRLILAAVCCVGAILLLALPLVAG